MSFDPAIKKLSFPVLMASVPSWTILGLLLATLIPVILAVLLQLASAWAAESAQYPGLEVKASVLPWEGFKEKRF